MSCKRFAQFVASDRAPIDPGYRAWHFWTHWLVCPFCRRYRRELQEISRVRQEQARLSSHPLFRLDAFKKRLLARFQNQK